MTRDRGLSLAAPLLLGLLVGLLMGPGALFSYERDELDGQPVFVEVAAQAGIDFVHERAVFDPLLTRIMAWMTSINAGVAATDYDGDGDVDLYFLTSRRGKPNALYRNDGDLVFVEVAEESGLAALNDAAGVSMDALFADLDGDGDQDLFVASYGRSRLLLNEDGRFREVGEEAGLAHPGNAATALVLDHDNDGWLDLMVGNYFGDVDLWKLRRTDILQTNFHNARNGGANLFYRNNRDGSFSEVGGALGLDDTGWTLALGGGDLDSDGDTDVYVANDYGYDVVYRNDGGSFTDVTAEATGGADTAAGMNVDMGDYDGDGDLDIYVTNITNQVMPQGNMLWSNEGELVFTDVARRTGSANGGWGWGAKFLDFDNDGDLDIYTVNGFVSDGPRDIFRMGGQLNRGNVSDIRVWPDMRGLSLSGYEKSRLFRNDGGVFAEVGEASGVASDKDGRGVAVADLDDDGDLDLVVSNCNASPLVYRNQTAPSSGWLEVDLVGSESNRDAIGARVSVIAADAEGARRSTQVREVDGGNGFSAQSARTLHFGLGPHVTVVDVEVRWPSGKRQRFSKLPAGTRIRVTE